MLSPKLSRWTSSRDRFKNPQVVPSDTYQIELYWPCHVLNLYLICVASSLILLAAPAAAAIASRAANCPSIITFSFFVVLQQLLFAFVAAVLTSYEISFPLAAIAVVLIGLTIKRNTLRSLSDEAPTYFYSQLLPWIIFISIFFIYVLIRAQYSHINFNNNGDEAGVEKLFNLSLQQSFLFGKSYPPEWIWLSGEPVRYYIFLKSIPGLAAWIARVFFGNAQTGGIFFILFDAIYAALAPAVLCGWVLQFGRRAKNHAAVGVTAVLLALFCLVGTHYQAVSLGLDALLQNTPLDWWSLSAEVIPYTNNQYPIWFMLLGDSHAYMQVYFLQILFWGAFLSVVVLENFSFTKSACLGILAAALLLSHSGSVLVAISVLSIFIVTMIGRSACSANWIRLKNCALHAIVTLAVAAFFLNFLYEPAGNVKIVIPDKQIVSPLLAFINLNFSILIWIGLVACHPAVWMNFCKLFAAAKLKRVRSGNAAILGIAIVLTVIFYLFQLPALSLMILMSCLTYFLLFSCDLSEPEKTYSLFAVTSFSIWFLPELIAFDHTIDIRTTWIRFQMSLRFWPEGYILIPFAITVAVIQRIGDKVGARIWYVCVTLIIALFTLSHIAGISNRIMRSRQAQSSLNGFAEFDRRYPDDSAIVAYLQTLPQSPKVVIAESCGIGDSRVPLDFAWPGRISAFSGRAAVCGWARHAILYNNPLRQLGFRYTSVEERTADFLKSYLGLFLHLGNAEIEQAALDLNALKSFGVTHIVFGQFEKILFPSFSVENTPQALSLRVVFKASNGMGVLKIDE